jgi:hypothetical protein
MFKVFFERFPNTVNVQDYSLTFAECSELLGFFERLRKLILVSRIKQYIKKIHYIVCKILSFRILAWTLKVSLPQTSLFVFKL